MKHKTASGKVLGTLVGLIIALLLGALLLGPTSSIAGIKSALCVRIGGCDLGGDSMEEQDKSILEGPTQEQIKEVAEKIASCYETKCKGFSFTPSVSNIKKEHLIKWLDDNKLKDKGWRTLLDLAAPLDKEKKYELYFIPEGCMYSSFDYILLRYEGGTDPCLQFTDKIKIIKTIEPSNLRPNYQNYWRFEPSWSDDDREHQKNYLYIFFDKEFKGWNENVNERALETIGSTITIYKNKNLYRFINPFKQPENENEWELVCEMNCRVEKTVGTDIPKERYYIALTNLEKSKYYLIEFNTNMAVGKNNEKIFKDTSIIQFEIE